MKTYMHKISEAEIRKTFPIKSKTSGWHFRVKEISINAWEVEGSDQWGRIVCRQGTDPEELMAQCELEAEKISSMTKGT